MPAFRLSALKWCALENFEQFIEGFAGSRNFGIGERVFSAADGRRNIAGKFAGQLFRAGRVALLQLLVLTSGEFETLSNQRCLCFAVLRFEF